MAKNITLVSVVEHVYYEEKNKILAILSDGRVIEIDSFMGMSGWNVSKDIKAVVEPLPGFCWSVTILDVHGNVIWGEHQVAHL